MKKLITLTILTLAFTVTKAASPYKIHHNEDYRGFGGLSIKTTTVGSAQQTLFGGMGASYITSNFYWGGGGFGTVSTGKNIEVNDNGTIRNSTLEMGYGGFMFGNVQKLGKRIKLNYNMLFGFGGFSLTGENFEADESFFVMEPTANFYYSASEWFHTGIGSSYRFANLTSGFIDNSDFNRVSFNINFVFGKL